MTVTPEFLADRIAWTFRRSGGQGVHTKEFSNFDPGVQSNIREAAQVGTQEVPALLCYSDSNTWALITSERLVWMADGKQESIPLVQITDATVASGALLQARSKQKLSILTVVRVDGSRRDIRVEAGEPFVGFWNALKMVAAGNR